MDELLQQFLIEARDLVPQATAALDRLRVKSSDGAAVDAAFRAVHTLKGSVALFDMVPAGRTLHAAEDILDGARSGRLNLDAASILALLGCIDRVDAWIDAMEAEGRLPNDAGIEADRLLRRLGGHSENEETKAATRGEMPEWLPAMLSRMPTSLRDSTGDLVAFCYDPDGECFFRGDDPLSLVASVPELVALDIRPREAWPQPDLIDPFHCNLRLHGISAAPLAAVQAVLRKVGEQSSYFVVPRPQEGPDIGVDAARTVRVDERRIDRLVDDVGELVVSGNGLASLVAEIARVDAKLAQRLRVFQAALDRNVAAMQRSVTAVRLVSVGPAVRRLPRLVREIASSLGREVSFTIEGENTEVDKAIADTLFEPLLHLVRNALDHGIEPPERRRALGKSVEATLRLRFARSGERLEVTLSDDGAGIDPELIRATAIARGVVTQEAASLLDDRSVVGLIFAPGFSTAEQVTDLSGRGVGMDAVRRAVEGVGGRMEVESAPGAGTTMHIVLPLSAITTRLLIVHAGDERYAIPFDRIAETATIAAARVMALGGGEALVMRGATLPLLHLAELLGGTRRHADTLRLIVTHMCSEPVALAIDAFGERMDARVRPVSGLLATVPGVFGTALLGSGEVLVVLDPERLIG